MQMITKMMPLPSLLKGDSYVNDNKDEDWYGAEDKNCEIVVDLEWTRLQVPNYNIRATDKCYSIRIIASNTGHVLILHHFFQVPLLPLTIF